MLKNTVQRQTVTSSVEAWISAIPSDIIEPAAVDAAKNDPYIGKSGSKPLFMVGFDDPSSGGIGDEQVRHFLDAHEPKSVVLVSFGTMVDAGSGAVILFEGRRRSARVAARRHQGVDHGGRGGRKSLCA